MEFEFEFESRINVGEEEKFKSWHYLMLFLAAVIAALVTMVSITEKTTAYIYNLLLPILMVMLVGGTMEKRPAQRSCKCRVRFNTSDMFYDVPAIDKTERDYDESCYIEYEKIDCIEFDPPTLQLRISFLKPYVLRRVRKADGEEILDDWEDMPICMKFVRKEDAEQVLYMVRRYITEDVYINGIDW